MSKHNTLQQAKKEQEAPIDKTNVKHSHTRILKAWFFKNNKQKQTWYTGTTE